VIGYFIGFGLGQYRFGCHGLILIVPYAGALLWHGFFASFIGVKLFGMLPANKKKAARQN